MIYIQVRQDKARLQEMPELSDVWPSKSRKVHSDVSSETETLNASKLDIAVQQLLEMNNTKLNEIERLHMETITLLSGLDESTQYSRDPLTRK